MNEPWCFKAASTYLFCGTRVEFLTLFSLEVDFLLLLVTFLVASFVVVSILFTLLHCLIFTFFRDNVLTFYRNNVLTG